MHFFTILFFPCFTWCCEHVECVMETCLPIDVFLINQWWWCLSKGPIRCTCSKLRYKTMGFLMKIMIQPSVIHGLRANYPPAGPLAMILSHPSSRSLLQPHPTLLLRAAVPALALLSPQLPPWLLTPRGFLAQRWWCTQKVLPPRFMQPTGVKIKWFPASSKLLAVCWGLFFVGREVSSAQQREGTLVRFFFPCTYLKLFLFLFPPCDGTGSQ